MSSDKYISKGKAIRASARIHDEQLIAEVMAEASAVSERTVYSLDEAVDILVESGYGIDDPWLLKDWKERHGR